MMRMTVLASGSKGNSTLVASSRTRILVDAGLSCRELLRRMLLAGEDPSAIDAVVITHEHQDHVQGVAVLARKLGIPVYFTDATHRAWMRWMTPRKRLTYAEWLTQRQQAALQQAAAQEAKARPAWAGDGVATAAVADNEGDSWAGSSIPGLPGDAGGGGPALESARSCDGEPLTEAEQEAEQQNMCSDDKAATDPCALPAVEYFTAGGRFSIGDIAVTPFTIPHDAADPVGFVFEAEGVRMAMATDLGYMPPNVRLALRQCDVLLLESNHDVEMLRDGPYPWPVKQRVLSRVGHLSNEATAEFLERNYDGYASYVVLAHLSESNNLPELARVSAERALRDRMNLLANKLVLAQQGVPSEPICVG